MKRQYDTGLDANSISMQVKVGTVGEAYTAAYLLRSGGQWNKITESTADSGSIKKTNIGFAADLRKSYVVVRTLIDLSNLNEAERESAANTIFIEYKFSGGFAGTQTYNFDLDDITKTPDNRFVSISKPIELI
ncbi:MAG: hypothetical protein IT257_04290 [Chitinophagaceae bacterium]|nr:hypothetical protein [Chitinophagaceae bacterium]